jgi:pilus assembly protein Flp/PilA
MRAEFGWFLRCQDGATAIEYAFIAGLVSIGIITALNAMSGSITGLFNSVSSTLSGAASG